MANWKMERLRDVIDVNPPRRLQRGSESTYVAMDDLARWNREVHHWTRRSFRGSGSRFHNGDTLLARITPCLENGKTVFVNFLRPNEVAHGSTEFIVMSGKDGKSDKLFIYYLARSEDFRGYAIQRMEGTSGRQRVSATSIGDFKLSLPPIDEQHSIGKMLGMLDDKIEINRKMNATLEVTVQTIFKSWFIDFDPVRAKMEGREPFGMDTATAAFFPDSFEDSGLGEIPAGWGVKLLSDAIEVNPFRRLRKGETAPYLDMANMPTHSARALSVIDREFGSGTKFMDGDTLVARITPCLENGKTAFVDFLNPSKVGWGSTEFIVLHAKPPLPPEYAYFLARSDSFRSFAIANMSGSSGRQRVPADCLDHFQICIPPAFIVEKFGEIAESALAKMKSNDEESRTLTALRDALLPKLISGELRVTQAEQRVASHA